MRKSKRVWRRAVAVELGEVGEDAAAEPHTGEGRTCRAVDLVEIGDAEGCDLLQGELQEACLLRHDGRPARARARPADLGCGCQLVSRRPLAGHRDLQHDLGIEGLGQSATGGQSLCRVRVARVAFADDMAWSERLEQVEPVVEVVPFRSGGAEPDLRHVRPGLAAE